jgi:hypothetical protein
MRNLILLGNLLEIHVFPICVAAQSQETWWASQSGLGIDQVVPHGTHSPALRSPQATPSGVSNADSPRRNSRGHRRGIFSAADAVVKIRVHRGLSQ